jgi:hypothetical protein
MDRMEPAYNRASVCDTMIIQKFAERDMVPEEICFEEYTPQNFFLEVCYLLAGS